MLAYSLLEFGRYMIFLAVLGSILASFACLIYGAAEVVIIILRFVRAGNARKGGKSLSVSLLADVDLFLLGTVFYIIAAGLYELFINEGAQPPAWLVVHDLDDLKPKMIDGVVLILAIHYLQQLVDWDHQTDLLRLSISIALIIAVLTFFVYGSPKIGHGAAPTPAAPQPAAVHEGGH